jgi:serine/threonine-protein kinase
MVQVYVPEGEFLMGSDDQFDAEKPQHTVYLDAYWLDQTEVTTAMFAAFVQATGYETDAEKEGSSWVYNPDGQEWESVSGADWQHPRGPGSPAEDTHPVVHVSWNDAEAYCAWAGRRLATEAEWEKGARGPDGRLYPWGDDAPAGNLLNFADVNLNIDWADTSIDDGYAFTAPVGSYPAGASPYGALDMAGNVWEWVADWYSDTYYATSPADNPTGPASGDSRAQRGGSWDDNDRYVRAAYRFRNSPVVRLDLLGFRCALSP